MFELDGVSVLKHSSIKIKKEKIIYIDPFQIDLPLHDADLILCTHSHYDHFSPKDILAVANESTVIITTADCQNDIEKMGYEVGYFGNRIDIHCEVVDRSLNRNQKIKGIGNIEPAEHGFCSMFCPNPKFYGKKLKYHVKNLNEKGEPCGN